MENHLGRNPFDKARNSTRQSRPIFANKEQTSTLEWILIQLPAKAFIFALKTGILVKSAFEKQKSGS